MDGIPPVGIRVGMLVLNDMRYDSRVRHEAAALAAAGHQVTVYALLTPSTARNAEENIDGYRIIRLPMPGGGRGRIVTPEAQSVSAGAGLTGRLKGLAVRVFVLTRPLLGGTFHFAFNWWFRWGVWRRRVGEVAEPADVWHAHDLNTLPAAVALARRDAALVLYDSHEVFTEAGFVARVPRLVKLLIRRQEARWARACARVITVNQSVADHLQTVLGIPRVDVIHNCSTPVSGSTRRSPLRRAIGVGPDAPVVLYHGSLTHHRGLADLVAAARVAGLEGVHLAFMGYGPLRDDLRGWTDPALGGRVHLLPPVPPEEVVDWVRGADLAAMPIQRSTLNHYLASPNKLFEALAAGIPVVGPDYPEFRRILAGEEGVTLGAFCDPSDPLSIADAILRILRQPVAARRTLRAACLRAARSRWNWQAEAAKLVSIYAAFAPVSAGEAQPRRAAS